MLNQSVMSEFLRTPWTAAFQVPLSVEFSTYEYWSRLPFPAPGDLPYPGIKPLSLGSPALQAGSFAAAPPGKPHFEAIYIFQSTVVNIFSAEIYRPDISSHKDKEFK